MWQNAGLLRQCAGEAGWEVAKEASGAAQLHSEVHGELLDTGLMYTSDMDMCSLHFLLTPNETSNLAAAGFCLGLRDQPPNPGTIHPYPQGASNSRVRSPKAESAEPAVYLAPASPWPLSV